MAERSRYRIVLQLYRAGVLMGLGILIHQQARWLANQKAPTVSLRQAGRFFPEARHVEVSDPLRGLHVVTDPLDDTLGGLMTTAPWTDHIMGYSGPNNVLIVLDPNATILEVELLASGDTREQVEMVRTATDFLPGLSGWNPAKDPVPPLNPVSGATLTSFAVLESVQERLAGSAPSLRFPEPVTLEELRGLFPDADHMEREADRVRVFNSLDHLLGYVLRTSPQADNVSGYQGPTECLVALDPEGRSVVGIQLRKSYDTPSYVEKVRDADSVKRLFLGRTLEEVAELQFPREKLEGVSRSTLTARALVEGVQRRFAAETKTGSSSSVGKRRSHDIGLFIVVVMGLVMALTPLRGHIWVRVIWQMFLVGYVGLINHDMLSLALLGGWASNGLALKAVPGLVLLAATALLVPWSTGRQIYCHQICPHGAAQQLLGKALGRRLPALPSRMEYWLERIPVALLVLAALALLTGWTLNLAAIEAFDAWNGKNAGVATMTIAVVGLGASLFVPMAYCRFGCPTGVLFSFVRSSGSGDRWGRRDYAALALLIFGFGAVIGVRALPRLEAEPEPVLLSGHAMGTTWSVKMRDELASPPYLKKVIAKEFEWAESLTSHWRPETDVSIFNRTRTTQPMEVPWPVLMLSRWSTDIHRETEGAFDITVGPLLRLWGFGPNTGGEPRTIPSDAELIEVLKAVGLNKLELLYDALRKQHPALEVDLSSIAKGWAINKVVDELEFQAYTNFLVEAGGELRAVGRWKIAIERPVRATTLLDESIATSGIYRQNYKVNTKRYNHLIDPRTGRPITHSTVSVSVRHKDCARADAWATALNVMGLEEGLPVADRLNLSVQFVDENRSGSLTVVSSSAWKKREEEIEAGP